MTLEVVLWHAHRWQPGHAFASKAAEARPAALFVDPVRGVMRRGGVVVSIKGPALRAALALAAGRVVTADEMVDAEYFGRKDGGPDNAASVMRLHLMRARAALAALGFKTTVERRRGFSAVPVVEEAA